jgi:hypothetical protein
MIVLGVVLILVAAAAGVFAVVSSSTSQMVHLEGIGLAVSVSPLAVYLAGALSVVLLGFGFSMITGGARRKASRRKELRRLRKAEADSGGGDTRAEQRSRRPEGPEDDNAAGSGSDNDSPG